MTVTQLKARIAERLDDGSNVYYTSAEMLAALNEAQRWFCFLTLCLESTGTIPLLANRAFYRIRGYLADYLLPLKITNGPTRLKPATLDELDARSSAWIATPGLPSRYCQDGMSFLAITPQPAGGGTLTILYAREPAELVANDDVPEIPSQYHEALVDYAIPYLRVKDGGSALAAAVPLFNSFLEAAQKCAEYVRARNVAYGYDAVPFELARFDRSRFIQRLTKKEK